MVNYWLAKQEPDGPRGYNIEQLKKDKKTMWDGVHSKIQKSFSKTSWARTNEKTEAAKKLGVITNF